VRFILHTGDIKGGGERCDDELLIRRFDQYQRFTNPFVLTPGDKDWTDWHRTSNGSYLPTERLTRLRDIFYPQPGVTSGGRPARVETQAALPGYATFVENTLWHFGGAVMGTVHVVGSNNKLAPWNQLDPADTVANPRPDRVAEFEARQAAALAWIDTIFDEAAITHAAGVLVAMQANPLFETPASDANRAGFNAVQTLENVTRAENFGSHYVHWVEVTVNPRDPQRVRLRAAHHPGQPVSALSTGAVPPPGGAATARSATGLRPRPVRPGGPEPWRHRW
jgi:hypothetical protein